MIDGHREPDRFATPPRPAAYHLELLQYLRTSEKDLWHWFASNRVRTQHADAVRLRLLRSTYRLDRTHNPQLYEVVDSVADRMQITVPVTVYQAQHAEGRNASLAWLPEEAHIVLCGDLQELLSPAELGAVFAHELAHHELFSLDDSALLIAEQILSAMLADRSCGPAHERTWRSFQLHTELWCDRRALDVSADAGHVISALIRIDTGLREVSAAAYLAQADEILSGDNAGSEQSTHPEMFIRAKSLAVWQDDSSAADDLIRPLIEGPWTVSELDLIRQARLTQFTEQFLRSFLQPKWLRTRITLRHARRFFADFSWTDEQPASELSLAAPPDPVTWDTPLQKYLCCVLLDFSTIDPELEDAPLAAAFLCADQYQLSDIFEETAMEELRLGKRHFRRIRSQAEEIVLAAAQESEE